MEIVIAWNITGTLYQIGKEMGITKEQLAMIGAMILKADPTAKYIHCSVNVKEMRIAIVIDKDENIDVDSADIDWGVSNGKN